jgi:3',5'-cyclic AMP phosphodiesterase CpdA
LPPPTAGAFSLAVLPDTQIYSRSYPGLFLAQTGWIAAQAGARNIRFVIHLGDVVHENTPVEWERAARAMALLDGVVPYAIVPGNHDYGPNGSAATRQTGLNEYFSFAALSAEPTFGGAWQEGRLENTYHLFSGGGQDFILLALEWAPRDEVIAWGNEIMRSYPDRLGILATHAYLNQDGQRYDHRSVTSPQDFNPHLYSTPGPVNDGEELWQKLVRHHRFVMTLNGHVLGRSTGYLASRTDRGTTCHQMLSNYQTRAWGGDGYLRLIECLPNQTVRVFAYSALHDRILPDPDHSFCFGWWGQDPLRK